jgi:hypothetical protein
VPAGGGERTVRSGRTFSLGDGVKCGGGPGLISASAWYDFIRMSSRNPRVGVCLTVAATLFYFTLSTGAAGLPPASESNGPATPQEREAFADKFVHQKLQVWKERMNLTDWDLSVNLVRTGALEPRTLGNIHWDTDAKRARIAVLSSYDYHLPFPAMLKDMEFTVVHELVHLQLASLPRSEASRRQEEHAVNELARSLIGLATQ